MKNLSLTPEEAKKELAHRELARRHFSDFASYVYREYKSNWHLTKMCQALEDVYNGKIRFLLIEMPPRHGKSLHVSQLFPAWVFGKNADNGVIVASYSGDLATDHGRETRNLMGELEYKNVFETELAPDSTAKGKFHTNGKGTYNASGVGGSVTGKGAQFFIVDDPFKDRKEADSVLIRDDRWKWLKSVARTRLTPTGAMIIMHTRWHDDDIIGRIKSEEDVISYNDYKNGKPVAKWVELKLQAIAEQDEDERKAGEPLWADHYDIDELTAIKKDIGGYEWSALYQQEPVDDENRMFMPEWFKYKELTEVEELSTSRYLTIDTKSTNAKDAGTDYIGVCLNFVDSDNNWYLRSERVKLSSKGLVDLMFNWYTRYQVASIGIEKTAFTEGLKPYIDQEMRTRNMFLPIVELSHGGTRKEIRIEGLAPRYERGSIYHIKQSGTNLCADLEEELLRFPIAKNDDASDATAYQNQIAEPRYLDEDEEINLYNYNVV